MRRTNDTLSVILKLMLIITIVAVLVWVGISVWGNIVIDNQKHAGELPAAPSAEKAPYQVNVTASNQVLYCRTYSIPRRGVYVLEEYYSVNKGKWVFSKVPLEMDSFYWGPITVTARTK